MRIRAAPKIEFLQLLQRRELHRFRNAARNEARAAQGAVKTLQFLGTAKYSEHAAARGKT